MRHTQTILALVTGCLLSAALACSSKPQISSVRVGKDEKVNRQESTFKPGETLYSVAEISNPGSRYKLRFRIAYNNVPGQKAGETAPSTEKNVDAEGSSSESFAAKIPDNFRSGTYDLQVRLADKDDNPLDGKTITFTVAGDSAGQPPANENKSSTPITSDTKSTGVISLFRLKLTATKGLPIESPSESTFAPTDNIYVIFTLDNTAGGEIIYGKLYAEDAEGLELGAVVRSNTYDQISSAYPRMTAGFNLDPREKGQRGWAKGTYRYELSYTPANGGEPKVLKSLDLAVE